MVFQNSSGLKDSTRHAGALFGPDITKHFLEVNRLKLVVRSHECVDEGFNVSVFSAGAGTSRGGIIVVVTWVVCDLIMPSGKVAVTW
jgi:hypothetical protein